MSISSGYELHRLETFNWGNFQGYQSIDLSKNSEAIGPLSFLNPQKAAVFSGINGAGKTTLIDPIFCILMPFQNKVNLGVIADAEKSQKRGSGRSVADYVLGKHSASDEENPSDPGRYYSRKTGMSAVLLVFCHRETGKKVTLARLWWYSDYRLKEDQGFLLIHGEGSIQDPQHINVLKDEGQFFESASSFRKGMKAKGRFVEVSSTPTEFLQIASRVLNYNPEDIILLNKAFYIKSISNIDTFVRENMLLEVTKDSVDRLCENIQKASEIFKMIKNEQLKLDTANQILAYLKEAKGQYENQFLYKVEVALTDLIQTYRDRKEAEQKRIDIEDKKKKLIEELPDLEEKIEQLSKELTQVRTQASKTPIAEKLSLLDLNQNNLENEIKNLEKDKIQVEQACKNLSIAPPKDPEDEGSFKERVNIKIESIRLDMEASNERLREVQTERIERIAIQKELKKDLEHYSRHATLIPDRLYAEKSKCIKDLGLRPSDLMFVGELIEVPEKFQTHRRAAESVLRPISRNLLCHPDALEMVEKWINENKLKSDLTVKRITKSELSEPPRSQIPSNSVLHYIVVKPEKENPFYSYLSRWIRATFWHEVVSVSDLRSDIEKAVTLEGLVKSDTKTMTKYRHEFDYSLGWDNRVLCENIKMKLVEIETELKNSSDEEKHIIEKNRKSWELQNFAAGLAVASLEYLQLKNKQKELIQIKKDIKDIRDKNPDFDRLNKRINDLESTREELKGNVIRAKTNIDNYSEKLIELENLVSARSAVIQDAISREIGGRKITLVEHFKTAEAVFSRLEALDMEIRKKGVSPHEHKTYKEKSTPSPQQALNNAGITMAEYKKIFNDPDLVYTPPAKELDTDKLLEQWNQVIDRVTKDGLPKAMKEFQDFYSETLFDSTKAAISDINGEKYRIERDINAINETLKLNNFERLANEERFLQIFLTPTKDEQIRAFDRELKKIQTIISSEVRVLPPEERANKIMTTLEPFVKTLEDIKYRQKVVDARNHYSFSVKSYCRGNENSPPIEKETFRGAGSDGKSGGQTAQLCYALLAASVACRFYFYDPVRGKDTLRIFLVDEFNGKFDNEKPQDIMRLLDSMGFQAIVLTPMSKLETLRGFTNRVVFVYKRSATESVTDSIAIDTAEDGSLQNLFTNKKLTSAAEVLLEN